MRDLRTAASIPNYQTSQPVRRSRQPVADMIARSDVPALSILGVPVALLTVAAALAEVESLLANPGPAMLAYVNAHSLNLATRDAQYRAVLGQADLVLNDGAGLALAAKMHGTRFPANLNGTDLNPLILTRAAAADFPVFLLGGRPGVARAAADNLAARVPGLHIAGHAHGYLEDASESALLSEIRASGAQVLMVGMGNPRQELWLAEHLPATGVRLGVGVGAFLDFAAGVVPRAPQWMRAAGIEWLYRLMREPGRLWRRYVMGNPAFLIRAAIDGFGQMAAHKGASARGIGRTAEVGTSTASTAPMHPGVERSSNSRKSA
jgi:exopolysaccharide biosynthesis WecB/TagA/CpsF family protein